MNPQRLHVEYPSFASSHGLNPDWIVGFVDGEGCFHVGISRNEGTRFGYQILPELTIVQHERDLSVLYSSSMKETYPSSIASGPIWDAEW